MKECNGSSNIWYSTKMTYFNLMFRCDAMCIICAFQMRPTWPNVIRYKMYLNKYQLCQRAWLARLNHYARQGFVRVYRYPESEWKINESLRMKKLDRKCTFCLRLTNICPSIRLRPIVYLFKSRFPSTFCLYFCFSAAKFVAMMLARFGLVWPRHCTAGIDVFAVIVCAWTERRGCGGGGGVFSGRCENTLCLFAFVVYYTFPVLDQLQKLAQRFSSVQLN